MNLRFRTGESSVLGVNENINSKSRKQIIKTNRKYSTIVSSRFQRYDLFDGNNFSLKSNYIKKSKEPREQRTLCFIQQICFQQEKLLIFDNQCLKEDKQVKKQNLSRNILKKIPTINIPITKKNQLILNSLTQSSKTDVNLSEKNSINIKLNKSIKLNTHLNQKQNSISYQNQKVHLLSNKSQDKVINNNNEILNLKSYQINEQKRKASLNQINQIKQRNLILQLYDPMIAYAQSINSNALGQHKYQIGFQLGIITNQLFPITKGEPYKIKKEGNLSQKEIVLDQQKYVYNQTICETQCQSKYGNKDSSQFDADASKRTKKQHYVQLYAPSVQSHIQDKIFQSHESQPLKKFYNICNKIQLSGLRQNLDDELKYFKFIKIANESQTSLFPLYRKSVGKKALIKIGECPLYKNEILVNFLNFLMKKQSQIISSLYESDSIQSYCCRLFIQGRYQSIVVDDRFAYDSNYIPIFGQVDQYLWFSVMIKCFATILGSYSAIKQLKINQIYTFLTGRRLVDITAQAQKCIFEQNPQFEYFVDINDEYYQICDHHLLKKLLKKTLPVSQRLKNEHSYQTLTLFLKQKKKEIINNDLINYKINLKSVRESIKLSLSEIRERKGKIYRLVRDNNNLWSWRGVNSKSNKFQKSFWAEVQKEINLHIWFKIFLTSHIHIAIKNAEGKMMEAYSGNSDTIDFQTKLASGKYQICISSEFQNTGNEIILTFLSSKKVTFLEQISKE